jgi:hypothetical protein
LAGRNSEKFRRLPGRSDPRGGGRDIIPYLATATAAAVICSHAVVTAATVVATAVTAEEKNEDDEKEPVVIASATHDVTSLQESAVSSVGVLIEASLFYQALTLSSYVIEEKVLQIFR